MNKDPHFVTDLEAFRADQRYTYTVFVLAAFLSVLGAFFIHWIFWIPFACILGLGVLMYFSDQYYEKRLDEYFRGDPE